MNENILKDIGLNIVLHRKLRGINQADFARTCNLSVRNLSKIERGMDVNEVPLVVYLRIAEKLNVSLADLLKTTDVRVRNICVKKI